MVDLSGPAVQAFLFAVFAGLTAVLAAIIGPTYDNLLVPELQPSSLFPAFPATGGPPSFLSQAASFSSYLVADLVDPAVALVGAGLAVVFLARGFFGRWKGRTEPLLGRLVLAVLLANFTLPITGAILGLAGATFPVIAGWDGGAWQHWINLAGYGELRFSWDNGALAFIVSFALFALVLLLAAAVALRDALLAVLIVLLPVFTLLWPIPTLSPLARRAWLWFAELAFLPCVVVVPLELAVGSSSILILLGFLTAAVGAPALLSMAGTQLSSVGLGSASSTVSSGMQRGFAAASQSTATLIGPIGRVPGLAPEVRTAAASAGRSLGRAAFPASIPVLASDFLGRGTAHLVRHLSTAYRPSADRFPGGGSAASGGRSRAR